MDSLYLSSTQNKLNEDNYLIGKDYIVVMDGATDLTNNPKYNANWFVLELEKTLKIELDKKYDLKDTLRNSVNEVKKKVEDTFNEVSCSIIIVREINDKIEYLSLGDCTGVIQFINETKVLYNTSLEKLDNLSLEVLKEQSIKNNTTVLEAKNTIEVKNIILKHRNLKNTKEGYYTCDLSNVGVDNADYYIFNKNEIKNILLMSDGFDDVVSRYKVYKDYDELIKVIYDNSIEYVKEVLYKIQEEDKDLNKYVRFKKSDDITCVLTKI